MAPLECLPNVVRASSRERGQRGEGHCVRARAAGCYADYLAPGQLVNHKDWDPFYVLGR